MGGFGKTRVTGIWITKTNRNYALLARVLLCLQYLTSENHEFELDSFQEKHLTQILAAFPSLDQTNVQSEVEIDEYIKAAVQLWVKRKTSIFFDPVFMKRTIRWSSAPVVKLVKLISNPIEMIKPSDFSIKDIDDTAFINLPKAALLNTFAYATELIFFTKFQFPLYPFSLLSLLSLVEASNLSRIVIKGVKDKEMDLWYEKLWIERKDVRQRYEDQGFKVQINLVGEDLQTEKKWMIIERVQLDP